MHALVVTHTLVIAHLNKLVLKSTSGIIIISRHDFLHTTSYVLNTDPLIEGEPGLTYKVDKLISNSTSFTPTPTILHLHTSL